MTAPAQPGRFDLGGDDARLVVPAAAGAPRALPLPPAPDVARLPGARLVAFDVVEAGPVTLQIGCVRASSDRWVPGLESLVFERALGLALAPSALHPERLTRGVAPELAHVHAAERWSGALEGGRDLEVLHLLAFVGGDADALACTVLCRQDAASSQAGVPPCVAAVDAVTLAGELRGPPPPGVFARGLVWSAEHPLGALGLGATVAALVVVLLLRTRPRRRPTAAR